MRLERWSYLIGHEAVQIALCLPAYSTLMFLYFLAFPLDESAYFSASISVELLSHPGSGLVLAGNLVVLALARQKTGWQVLEAYRPLRLFTLFVAGVLAWRFACLPYNFYFDQAYLLDRALLVALWALVYVHPLFLGPFLALCVAFALQLQHPVFHYSFTDKRALFDYLVMFNAAALLRSVVPIRTHVFLLVALSTFAASYFVPAISKLLLGPQPWSWVLENPVSNLFLSSYLNGWLAFLPEATMLRVTGLLSHVAIVLSSGIFFWKWILLGLAFAALLLAVPPELVARLYTKRNRAVSVLVILLSFGYLNAVPLGWYDSRVNNFYSFHVVAEDGSREQLRRGFFSPYSLPFAQARFYFLSDEPLLANTYGSVYSPELFRALQTAGPADIEALKQRFGANHHVAESKRAFEAFLRTYVSKRQREPEKSRPWDVIGTPQHILGFSGLEALPPGRRFERVEVRFHETLYDGAGVVHLRDEVVSTVSLAGGRSPDAALPVGAGESR